MQQKMLWIPIFSLMFLTATTTSAAVSGKTIAEKGNGKGAIACMTCHGDQGQGNVAAAYPYLAGQPAGYIVRQLQDFAAKKRSSPVMAPFASALSKDEINAVATYYSKLTAPTPADSSANKKIVSLGKTLATQGKWSEGVPACYQCHGDRGQGIAPNFPAINGQPSAYLKKQLLHWKNNERNNDPVGLMKAIVSRLSAEDIDAVSQYLASQSPVANKQ